MYRPRSTKLLELQEKVKTQTHSVNNGITLKMRRKQDYQPKIRLRKLRRRLLLRHHLLHRLLLRRRRRKRKRRRKRRRLLLHQPKRKKRRLQQLQHEFVVIYNLKFKIIIFKYSVNLK